MAQVRRWSTATPCVVMIWALTSISPWVWLGSGERFRVQLMNSARRSSYRAPDMAGPRYPVAVRAAAPKETWNRAHQTETLLSPFRSVPAGTG